ncbi:hypothetical protein FDECE_3026 [Fusarium decemcellulare]|nr:hypothetical protein FDECE_3026 [Fusarium decemcellulare]
MTTPASNDSRTRASEASGSSTAESNPRFPIREPQYISDEEGPWAQKAVITFDGGGIRGYSSLLILKKIMFEIRKLELRHHEYPAPSSDYYPWMGGSWNGPVRVDPEPERVDEYLPCHYFDYMAGTSTGGLSSIMLGRLRMSVDDALDEYTEFGNAVFGKPRWFHERSGFWYPRAKFSCRKTGEAFKMVVYRSLQRERGCLGVHEVENEQFKYREDRTRTSSMTVSWAIRKHSGVSKQYVWRSYDNNFTPRSNDSNGWNPSNAGPAHTTAIWEVARATTAAPRYFESIKIGDRKFLDGGMVANNPSLLALREINELHNLVPAHFVSIGTGLKLNEGQEEEVKEDIIEALRRASTKDAVRRKQFLKKYLEIGRHWTKWMTDTEGENGVNGWWSHCKAIGLTENAHRLNVDGNLHAIPLDDWRPANTGDATLEFIKSETDSYLRQPRVRAHIASIANKAVEIRRRRAATERWESFALDVEYYCQICAPTCVRHYHTRAGLQQHLEESDLHKGTKGPHGRQMLLSEIEQALNDGRTARHRHARTIPDWLKVYECSRHPVVGVA